MLGGATSGYCETGSVTYATAPTSMISTEITAARIGRSMNSRENAMILGGLAAGRRLDPPVRRGDPGARPHALDTAAHDAIVALEAGTHDAHAALEVPRLDRALFREAVLAQHPHESPRLVAQDRAVGHEQRLELSRAEQLQAAELAGNEETVGVGDQGAAAHRAGG